MALSLTRNYSLPLSRADVETPLLRWDLRNVSNEHEAILQLEEDRFTFSSLEPHELTRIVKAVNGRSTPKDIAEATGLELDLVSQVLTIFYETGIAKNLGQVQDDKIDCEHFIRVCRDIFPIWKQRLFSHPLWADLTSGKAPMHLFLGWLLEHYHYIEGANDRMSVAVAECNDIKIRYHIAHHYSEEYDHGKFLLKCLRNFGFDETTVLNSRPVPGTISLLNFMRRTGRQDGLNYAICSGFLESSGGDRNIAKSFLDCLEENYCQEKPHAIKPLRAHADLDESLGHGSLLEGILRDVGSISHARATEALTAGYTMLEVLERWSTDIERTYAHPDMLRRTGLPRYRPITVEPERQAIEVAS